MRKTRRLPGVVRGGATATYKPRQLRRTQARRAKKASPMTPRSKGAIENAKPLRRYDCSGMLKYNKKRWENNFRKLTEFVLQQGHADVRQHADNCPETNKLARWATYQRNKRKDLDPSQVAQLDNILFPWILNDAANAWNKNYQELLAECCEENQIIMPRGHRLASWLRQQRKAMRYMEQRAAGEVPAGTNKLTPEQMTKLRAIGISTTQTPTEAAWLRQLDNLKKFKAKFGHFRVPVKNDLEAFPRLGIWVQSQRSGFRNMEILAQGGQPKTTNKIRDWQIEALNEIGFPWRVRRLKKPEK